MFIYFHRTGENKNYANLLAAKLRAKFFDFVRKLDKHIPWKHLHEIIGT